MKKKILVLAMSLVLVVTMMPLSIFAASNRVVVPNVKNFSTHATGQKAIVINWSKSTSDKNVEYWLYKGDKPSGDWGSAIKTFAYNKTSWTDKKVKLGKKSYYMMRAVKTVNGKRYFGNYTKIDYGQPAPLPIQNLKAWALDCTHAKVSWKKSAESNVEYWLYRGTKPSGDWGVPIKKLANSKKLYSDKEVKPTSKYYYMVRPAVKLSNGTYVFGQYSNMDYAAPKAPPIEGFQTWASDASHVYVSWKASSNDDVSYWLSRTEDPDQSDPNWGYPDDNPIAMLNKGMSPWQDPNIQRGHKYYYKMQTFQCVDGKFYYGPYTKVDYAYPR